MDQLRLFIATPVPGPIHNNIFLSFRKQFGDMPYLRPVAKENLHITIKFLGTTPLDHIPLIIQAVESVMLDANQWSITTTSGICLPPQNPNALGLGIQKNDDLQSLYGDLERVLAEEQLAQPERRAYRPHITLARVDRATRMEAEEIERVQQWTCASTWQFSELILFESQLTRNGPIYINLKTFNVQ